jgi:hypothetical protein
MRAARVALNDPALTRIQFTAGNFAMRASPLDLGTRISVPGKIR